MIEKKLARFYKRFPVKEQTHRKIIKDRYTSLLKKEFQIDPSQIYFGGYFLSVLFSMILILIMFLIKLYQGYFIIGILFFFLFRKYITNYFNRYYEKKEKAIDSILIIVKNNLELYTFLPKDYDFCILFIKLMQISSQTSNDFKKFGSLIQRGYWPEKLLQYYETPSKSFREFIDLLLLTNFKLNSISLRANDRLEDKFAQFSKSIESRISVIFFIGIFFPIGLSFAAILQKINGFITFILFPIMLILLKLLTRYFTRDDNSILGVSLYENQEIRSEYLDFLEFFTVLSTYLIELTPEKAIIKSYKKIPSELKNLLNVYVKSLKSYNRSLESFLDDCSSMIKGKKTKIIFDSIKMMLLESSYNGSVRIKELLKSLKRHQNLEQERYNIIKSELFKTRLFQIILPIITGLICGIFPIIVEINSQYLFNINSTLMMPFQDHNFSQLNMVLFILSQYIMILINSYYFARIVQRRISLLDYIIISLLFFTCFIMSYYYLNSVSFNFDTL